MESKEKQPKDFFLHILLAQDMSFNATYYQPYYDVLPKTLPHIPIMWGKDDLNALEGSPLIGKISVYKSSIETSYEKICEIAPEFRNLATLEKFIWIDAIIMTRFIKFKINQKEVTALVPFGDMRNHMQKRQLYKTKTSQKLDVQRNELVISASDDFHQGEEILHFSGSIFNSDLLFNYGFNEENFINSTSQPQPINPYDVSLFSKQYILTKQICLLYLILLSFF